jgi:hypothetical protein
MSKDMYRSANGKTVDMGALRLKNEKTRAVGNMKVNARGDMINDKNQVIQSRNQQVGKQYQQQTQPSAPKGKK